jgi:DNA primase
MIDRIPDIKLRYSVIDEFRRDYPNHVRGNPSRKRMYCQCPWHDDHNPSLIIDETGYRCMSAKCGVHGDIIEYVMLRDNVGKNEAISSLVEGKGGLPPVRGTVHINHQIPSPPMSEVLEYSAHYLKAVPYFEGRGISEKTVKDTYIGYTEAFPWICRLSSGDVHRTMLPRFSIPNLRFGSPLSIVLRRDDAAAEKAVKNGGLASLIEKDLKRLGHDATMENIISRAAGPKYFRKGPIQMYNAERVVARESNGSIRSRNISLALVTEGEIDCLTLETLGVRAVSLQYKEGMALEIPFKNASHVYLIRDNDAAGYRNAKLIYDNMVAGGMNRITILHPPAKYKDVNELHGSGSLKPWLRSIGAYYDYPL